MLKQILNDYSKTCLRLRLNYSCRTWFSSVARYKRLEDPSPTGTRGATKAENQANLDRVLAALGIRQNYDVLVTAVKEGLGDSMLQWPNTTGYTFYLRELNASGRPANRAYLSLFTPEDRNGKIQIVLQARAIEVIEAQNVEAFAKAIGSNFVRRPTGWGEIWIDGRKPASDYAQSLTALAQRIAVGWKTKMESQSQVEAEEEVPAP